MSTEIKKHDNHRTGVRKVSEARFLRAIRESDGMKNHIASILGIHRNSVRNYLDTNPRLAEAYEERLGAQGDEVESILMDKIKDGDTQCILFYCQTRLASRGYVKKKEIVGDININQNIRHEQILSFKGLDPRIQAQLAVSTMKSLLLTAGADMDNEEEQIIEVTFESDE